jgi:hypothetical protein
MMEERVKDMIHESLKSGGGVTQAKGHDQELLLTLVISKGSLGDVFLFHAYLVVSKMEIKFCKVLGTTQFIQRSLMTRMIDLSFIVSLLRAQKLGHMCQVPSFLSTITIGEE